MRNGLGPLSDGSTVAIIGGGPGGVATALALQERARALGRGIRLFLIEGKRFGPERDQHHNECVGVLSPLTVELMERELAVPFPHHLTQALISGYVLHASGRAVVLDRGEAASIALERVQLDAYMIETARQRGVRVVPARVTGLEFHDDRVIVYTESVPVRADVVVGAFGMDEGTAALFARAVGYRPPADLDSIVTTYHPGPKSMQAFGPRIHAFLPRLGRIEFGAITPKASHLVINIAGAAVDAESMRGFLAAPEVWQVLPPLTIDQDLDPGDLRYFKGRFPSGLARRFAGDRYVIVGDAAGLVRAFKGKGVTSAVQTGIRAADVMIRHGISAAAFEAYRAANEDIEGDLPFGRLMRALTIAATRTGLMDAVLEAAAAEPRLRAALYEAVSADRPYREVLGKTFSSRSIRAIAAAALRGVRPHADRRTQRRAQSPRSP